MRWCLCIFAVGVSLFLALLHQPIDEWTRKFLFERSGSRSCVPLEVQARGSASPLRALTPEEHLAFQRDGVVVLRGMLQDEWVDRLRDVVKDVFNSPNAWDILYSWCVANFYGAQKSILLHHTSHCGREVAVFSPAATLAAALLGSTEVRVCEPTEALMSHDLINDDKNKSDSGHTAWHRDDVYIPVKRRDESHAAVVRFWIPLMAMTPSEFRFEALNNSLQSQEERAARNLTVQGTNFGHHTRVEEHGADLFARHTITASSFQAGDIVAFAGETPHIAEAKRCGNVSCARIILSFSGDNSEYVADRYTSLLPLHSNQTVGLNVRGAQFPKVYPTIDPEEWEPLRPSYREIAGAIYNALYAGSTSFSGTSSADAMKYVRRVSRAIRLGIWAVPSFDGKGRGTGLRLLDLKAHFATPAL